MPNPTAAMLVIGDEILSGRTRDANMHHLAEHLALHGVDLREARVVADDPQAIISAVQALSAAYDHVFTSGGIGPTHDDITAECIARAFDVGFGVRDDARAALEKHYEKSGTEMNEARLRMARIPDGADLIENPVSGAPGFSLGNVHVMAGVPRIFEAMVQSVMPRMTGGTPLVSDTLRCECGEGDIAIPLGQLANSHPGLSIGSYPFQGADGRFGTNIVFRGADADEVAAAKAWLAKLVAP